MRKVVRRAEREDMPTFVAKKREMFLLEMALGTKRDEIRKLAERARLKDEALRKSLQMVQEVRSASVARARCITQSVGAQDVARFAAFQAENEKRAKASSEEVKKAYQLKQKTITQVKRKQHEIATLELEISKLRDHLELCMHYKEASSC